MNRNPQISILQIDRNHPVPGPNRPKDRLRRLHAEHGEAHQTIETREIYNRSPRARSLENNENPAVISQSRRSQLDDTLLQESCNLRNKSLTPDGGGGVAREVNRNRGERRTGEEENTVALPEDLNNPILRTPKAPGVPKRGKAASHMVGRGKQLQLLKILLLLQRELRRRRRRSTRKANTLGRARRELRTLRTRRTKGGRMRGAGRRATRRTRATQWPAETGAKTDQQER